MHTPKTHFEQIPVEVVRKIATELPQEISAEKDSSEAAPTGGAMTGDDWRELAQKVQEETDNTKMMGMVEELIAKLDEADLRKRRLQMQNGGGDPSETPTS